MPTGPAPPAGYDVYEQARLQRGQVVIAGVPGYNWRHGCGPTAAGMVIGYWDEQGCSLLVPGACGTQTSDVNQMIASSAHYQDYSVPIDDGFTGLLRDNSYYGGAHSSHCLGDFMHTSWYSDDLYYGWSFFNRVDNSLRDYLTWSNAAYGSDYTCDSWNEFYGTFGWADLVSEVDAGRPLVLLVDTDADGGTDHFVTAVGYRDTQGYQEYACLDTWAPAGRLRWERFRPLQAGNAWGIYGATYFHISGFPDCNDNDIPDLWDIRDGTSLDQNGNGVPDECELVGDLDGDGDVDLSDLQMLLAAYGLCVGEFGYEAAADLDGNACIELADLQLLLSNYGL